MKYYMNFFYQTVSLKALKQVVREKQESNLGAEGGGGWKDEMKEEESSQVTTDRVGGNGLKLSQVRFRLDIRENFLLEGAVQPWHSSPGQ